MNYTKEQIRVMEDEANYFVMCLLMPKHLLEQEIKKLDIDLASDDALKYLAKKFDVSLTAMAVRLSHLNLFK